MDADSVFSVAYDEPRADSPSPTPPAHSASITGLSSFLALALHLEVPILSTVVSSERWQRSSLGAGASFLVARSYIQRTHRQTTYLGPGATIDGGASGLGARLQDSPSIVSKRINPSAGPDGACLAATVTEMRILAHPTLRDHDNIARLLCLDWTGDCADLAGARCWPSLLLECAAHGTLRAFLAARGSAPWVLKWRLYVDITDGLCSLHEHDIAHCDLKPENILVSAGPGRAVAKIADFGFAVVASDYDAETVLRVRGGTEPWNAPELALGRETRVADLAKADVYSAGLVFGAIALDGRAPWGTVAVSEVQEVKRENDDAALFRLLRGARAALQQHEEAWVQQILDVTVRTDPGERVSAAALLQLAAREFLGCVSAVLVRDKSPRQPAGILRGCHVAASPLPNVFCGVEDVGGGGEPFSGVPDFENPAKFKPWLLYKHALREITADLARRADGCFQDPAAVVSEALYQLSICHLEGYGVDKDPQRSLEFFRRAFDAHSAKARRAARNFYEALQCDFPPAMAATEEADLLAGAKLEVARPDRPNCPSIATETLSLRYPSAYERWVCSDEFRDWRLQQFAVRAAKLDVSRGVDGLSAVTEGLTELAVDRPYLGAQSIPSALQVLSNLHQRGPDGLTMLHHAAARGDSGLVRLLLHANADVNARTPEFGWTPLWMACAGGHFDLALALLDRGADVRCAETPSGRTVLHLLSRFRTRAEVGYVLQRALDSGVDVDAADSKGRTPLFATFGAWDLSSGAAAEMLLENGADPFRERRDGWHPLMCAVDLLDPDLVGRMLACPARKRVPDEIVQEALVDGLRCLISHPPSTHISRLGKRREDVLKRLLTHLSTPESTQRFLQRPETRGLSPLAAAAWLGRESLALWLLDLHPRDVDLRAGPASELALHLAIKRTHAPLVREFLDHGADPLLCDDVGENALHVAAVWMPAVLCSLADAVVRVHPAAVLDCRSSRGFTPFAMAVFEGSQEHLRCAEALRAKYNLAHDPCVGGGGGGETLLANIVRVGATIDAVGVAQVRYLLGRTPPPAFVAGRRGATLLQAAVLGWKNAEYADGALGYQVLDLLLETFPTAAHLHARDDAGCTALMTAASCANHVAVRRIRDHAAARGFAVDVNAAERRGFTALDLLGGGAYAQALGGAAGDVSPREAVERLGERGRDELDTMTVELLAGNVRRTKALLVQMGAVRSVYLSYIRVWTLIAPLASIGNDRLGRFLAAMKQEHDGLDFEPPEETRTPPSPDSHISLECEWRIATFTLRTTVSSTLTQAEHSALEQRRTAEGLLEAWRTNVGIEPWSATEYARGPPGARIEWDRGGRVWSAGDVAGLRRRVGEAWKEIVGCEGVLEY